MSELAVKPWLVLCSAPLLLIKFMVKEGPLARAEVQSFVICREIKIV